MATKRVAPVQTDDQPTDLSTEPVVDSSDAAIDATIAAPVPTLTPADDVPSLVGMTGTDAASTLITAATWAQADGRDVMTLVHDAVRPLATKARSAIMANLMTVSLGMGADPTVTGLVGQAVASAPTGPDPRATLGQALDNAALVLGQALRLAVAPDTAEAHALVAALDAYATARGIEPTDAHTNQAERWLSVGGRGSAGSAREGGLSRTVHGRRIDSLSIGTRLTYRGHDAYVVTIEDATAGDDAAGVMVEGDPKVYRSMTDAAKAINVRVTGNAGSVNGWQSFRVDGTRTTAADRVDGRAGVVAQ